MPANAVVVNFAGLSEAGTAARFLGTTVLQDGFRFESEQTLAVWQDSSPNHPVGGMAATSLLDYFAGATTTVSAESGELFSVASIDLASWGVGQTSAMEVRFIGTDANNGVVQQTFSVANSGNSTPALATFEFNSSFSNLVSLRFQQGVYAGSTAFQFNNLDVTVVPEPGTWALMLAGLGIFTSLARARRLSSR